MNAMPCCAVWCKTSSGALYQQLCTPCCAVGGVLYASQTQTKAGNVLSRTCHVVGYGRINVRLRLYWACLLPQPLFCGGLFPSSADACAACHNSSLYEMAGSAAQQMHGVYRVLCRYYACAILRQGLLALASGIYRQSLPRPLANVV